MFMYIHITQAMWFSSYSFSVKIWKLFYRQRTIYLVFCFAIFRILILKWSSLELRADAYRARTLILWLSLFDTP